MVDYEPDHRRGLRSQLTKIGYGVVEADIWKDMPEDSPREYVATVIATHPSARIRVDKITKVINGVDPQHPIFLLTNWTAGSQEMDNFRARYPLATEVFSSTDNEATKLAGLIDDRIKARS